MVAESFAKARFGQQTSVQDILQTPGNYGGTLFLSWISLLV